jgi:hypothetical protein
MMSDDKFTKSVTDLVVGHAVAGDSRKRNVISRFAAKIQARDRHAVRTARVALANTWRTYSSWPSMLASSALRFA